MNSYYVGSPQVVLALPLNEAQKLVDTGKSMQMMYADHSRSDWFDADDLAIELATWVTEALEAVMEPKNM